MKISKIAVIGLGYVGLPLAVEFGRTRPVIGFDINTTRISELKSKKDSTKETSEEDLISAKHLVFTGDAKEIADCNCYIVTVPTPIDKYKRPDLSLLLKASEIVGEFLKSGDIVIYESTVYPGCTEEECVPVLERVSGLKYNEEFFCGYSPERINPGDKQHRLVSVIKITSGSTPAVAEIVDNLYKEIIIVGTYRAESIKIAEAAKVIENTQRDLNIALVNELALIFNKMGIDTEAVFKAAGTKWNFLPFRPGLVGGHCIGVDPYYLTFKAESIGYHPEIILAGRRINDSMGKYIAEKTVEMLIKDERPVKGAKVLILGWTFKENVPDVRNTKVVDIYNELKRYGVESYPHDPHADQGEVWEEYQVALVEYPNNITEFDAIIIAVKHEKIIKKLIWRILLLWVVVNPPL